MQNELTFDDYYGNMVTISFCCSDNNIATTAYLGMLSCDGQTAAEIEITKWSDFYEINASVIPTDRSQYFDLALAEYDEYFETERELYDWIRSLSYQYNMCLIENR